MFGRRNKGSEPRARRAERREVDWPTRYQIEGSRDTAWRKCRVCDLGRDGLGVVLFDATPADVSAHRVVIELPAPQATLRPRGQVRHCADTTDGEGIRVGLEFTALSALERHILDSLVDAELSFAPPAARA